MFIYVIYLILVHLGSFFINSESLLLFPFLPPLKDVRVDSTFTQYLCVWCIICSFIFIISYLDAVLNVESSGNLSYTLPTTRLDMLQKFFQFLENETAPSSKDDDASGKKKKRSSDKKGKEKDTDGEELKENAKGAKSGGLIQDWGISQTSTPLFPLSPRFLLFYV